MITMTYDYKLKPNKSQVQLIETYLETCRKVYNYALRERKDWVNSRKSPALACSIHSEYIISADTPRPTYNSQCKSLTDAKKQYPELNLPHSQVLQQTLRILEAGAKGLFSKHTLDAGFGQFFNILSYVCWKRNVFFLKVDKDYTSQICPNCNTYTGKKDLSNRWHFCPVCLYQTNRDVAASQVIRNRGLLAVGQPVSEIASGGVLSGSIVDWLDKSL